MCDFRYFSINDTTISVPTHLFDVLNVFQRVNNEIDSTKHTKKSNDVLSEIQEGLQELKYEVEISKKRIKLPIFDKDGQVIRHINPDAYHPEFKTIIEVEAGRAVDNNQYLKDLIWAAANPEIDYLALAVRKVYSKNNKKTNKLTTQKDYEKIAADLEAISHHLKLPLKGVILIGY